MSPNDIDEDKNSEDALFNQEDMDRDAGGENTPTPDAYPHHVQPDQTIEVPELITHVQGYLNAILPHLVDAAYHRNQATNVIQSPPKQSTPCEVQFDSVMPDNILNYVVSIAIPALITVVDNRIGSILGTTVCMTRAAANGVDVAKQIRPCNSGRSANNRSVTRDGIKVTPKKSNELKSTKTNKKFARFHDLLGTTVAKPQSEDGDSTKRLSLSSLPTELITLIAESLCDADLYSFTCVSHYMAAIGCPKYLRRKGITLSARRFSLIVRDEGFKVLRVWRRSPDFFKVPILFCEFDFVDVGLVALQMQRLRKFIHSFPLGSQQIFDRICLSNFETTQLQHCLDLLRVVDETGCHAITTIGLTFHDACTEGGEVHYRIFLESIQELSLENCQLSPSQWMNFLSNLRITSLRELTIAGKMSMVAVYHFLSQHPDIRVLRLQGTAKDVSPSSRRLRLPSLRSLRGSSSQILHLLQSLTSPPYLDELTIACNSPTSSQRDHLLDKVMRCLTMTRGSLALEIRLSLEEVSVTELMHANICAPTAKVLMLPCTVSTVYIEFEDACDKSILAYCEAMMTALPLHYIKVAKVGLHHGAGNLVWGKCMRRDKLCELAWHTNT